MTQARHGEYKMPGGKLLVVDLDVANDRMVNVQLSGDFFLEPDTALAAINRALEGQAAASTEAALSGILRHALSADVIMYGISVEAIAVTVRRALDSETSKPYPA